MSGPEVVADWQRGERIGLPEAIYCAGKSVAQIAAILADAAGRAAPLLLTRLDAGQADALPPALRAALDYDPHSNTAVLGEWPPLAAPPRVAVVTGGTSDLPVAREAARTLRFHGQDCLLIADAGVAGLWRLLAQVETLRGFPVLIAVAGMDAALPTVLAGLAPGAIIAVPTSVGYGVAAGGRTALNALLASCAPGLTVVNIDNGYGAACAALRILRAIN